MQKTPAMAEGLKYYGRWEIYCHSVALDAVHTLWKFDGFELIQIHIEHSLQGNENEPTMLFMSELGSNLHSFESQQQFFSKSAVRS